MARGSILFPYPFFKRIFLSWHIQISPLFSFTEMWAWLYYIWLRSKGWGLKWCWCFYSHTHNPTNHESESCSVMSDSLWPHGLYSLWNSPGQNTGVGSLSLLQGIFPTQGSNLGLLHCRQILYRLSHQGSPKYSDPKESPKYWVGQKVHSGFSIRCYRKTQTKLLANPINRMIR